MEVARRSPNPSIPGQIASPGQLAAWLGGIAIFFLIWYATYHRARFSTTDRSPANLPPETGIYHRLNVFSGCNLVPFIGWGVYIMGLMSQEFTALGLEQNEFAAFVQTIPFSFMLWLAVGMVPLMTVLKLDFGPMQKAEICACQDTRSSPANAESNGSEIKGFAHANARPILVWVR